MSDSSKIAGLFPGQGSQQVGMGLELFTDNEKAKSVFEEADKALGFSLSTLCFEGPLEELTLTKFSQPAILTASYACFSALEPTLTAAAGHSLGEYTALVAAGVLSFSDAVQLVHKRGSYMQEAVPVGEGKMLAVMGLSEEEIRAAIEKIDGGVCEIANLNCPGQTVVAGDAVGIDSFSAALSGAKLIPLNVSAPFHCSLMKSAEQKLAADLEVTEFKDPQFPVYSNVTAKAISSGSEARDLLVRQVCSSVRWTESMQNLISEQSCSHSIEFGPGGVLSKLLKRIEKSVNRLEVANPQDLAPVAEAIGMG